MWNEEDQDYELNARYDYVREAFGDMILDNEREAYYDYCDECREEKTEPMSFADWKNAETKSMIARQSWNKDDLDNYEEIPF